MRLNIHGLTARLNTIITALSHTYISAERNDYLGESRAENALRNLHIWRQRV